MNALSLFAYLITAEVSMNSLKDRIFHRALTAQLDTIVPLKVDRPYLIFAVQTGTFGKLFPKDSYWNNSL